MIKETMRGAGKDVTYGFTDGLCRENPGSCGAGACMFFPNQEKIELHQEVSKRSSSRRTDGHKDGLGDNSNRINKAEYQRGDFFCDSQSGLGIL